jgi:hypothetical protein
VHGIFVVQFETSASFLQKHPPFSLLFFSVSPFLMQMLRETGQVNERREHSERLVLTSFSTAECGRKGTEKVDKPCRLSDKLLFPSIVRLGGQMTDSRKYIEKFKNEKNKI